MAIETTLRHVVSAIDALDVLSTEKLPLKKSYDISKILKNAGTEIEFFNKKRTEIIDKFAPQGTQMTSEIQDNILKELEELLDLQVKIEVNPVDLTGANINISAKQILSLEPFCSFNE